MTTKKITNIWGEEVDDLRHPDTKQTHFNYNQKKFHYFSDYKIALGEEAQNHPKLIELLAAQDPNEFEIILAQIAAYCEVILNDTYTAGDLDILCNTLTRKLITKRVGIVFS